MGYTREEILQKCAEAFADVKTFYQADFVNYRGVTEDTQEYYTEIIAAFLCENLNEFVSRIPMLSRSRPYNTATHLGKYSKNSNRDEEIAAIKMFNQTKESGGFDYIGEILDYQTPLKAVRTDVAGKIDLLGYDGRTLRILELKKPDSIETMLRCVLEGFTYMKTVDTKKLLKDFDLPADTLIKASPFVFKDGEQHKEMQEMRPSLTQLMMLLDSKPYYITEENGIYSVEE